MKNAIRCCIACILPCGALDVVRIVHSNGRVEELSGSIKADDILKAHPQHVLRKPSSPSDDGMLPKITIVPPEAKLQRGKIYFLLPVPPTVPHESIKKRSRNTSNNNNTTRCNHNNNGRKHRQTRSMKNGNNDTISVANILTSNDEYFNEIHSEKLSTQRGRRRGRVGLWRPLLESISETPIDG